MFESKGSPVLPKHSKFIQSRMDELCSAKSLVRELEISSRPKLNKETNIQGEELDQHALDVLMSPFEWYNRMKEE